MKILTSNPHWVYYLSDNDQERDPSKCGKWMFFFKGREFATQICRKAIESNIVNQCKHSTEDEGVVCFYLEVDDLKTHKAVLGFFIENNLIRKTKTGKLFNISFKLDEQTNAKQYGANFQSDMKLEKFGDLATGALYSDEKINDNFNGLFKDSLSDSPPL